MCVCVLGGERLKFALIFSHHAVADWATKVQYSKTVRLRLTKDRAGAWRLWAAIPFGVRPITTVLDCQLTLRSHIPAELPDDHL